MLIENGDVIINRDDIKDDTVADSNDNSDAENEYLKITREGNLTADMLTTRQPISRR
jgi:hypothetical protein